MKKLKLDLKNLDGLEILSRQDLKKITGGNGSGNCEIRCGGPGSEEQWTKVESCSTEHARAACGTETVPDGSQCYCL